MRQFLQWLAWTAVGAGVAWAALYLLGNLILLCTQPNPGIGP